MLSNGGASDSSSMLTLHLTNSRIIITSNVTGRHRGPKQKLRADYECHHYNARHIFHRRVRCHAFSLRCACI